MVDPTKRDITTAISRNASAAIDKPEALSSQRLTSTKSSPVDEVIGSLANAYENKRARQVNEWERLWRQKISDTSHRANL